MIDLKTTYMGLELKNPIIIGSSGLSDSLEGVKKLAENNAGAVVLKSLFEEQILINAVKSFNENTSDYPGAEDYIAAYAKDKYLNDYLELIENAKKEVDIPIIASINCVSDLEWVSFAKDIEKAGADALELNLATLPSNINSTSEKNEKLYFSVLEKVRKEIKIPISLKMTYFSAGLANLIQKLSFSKNLNGFVLFNKFYEPDIDIDKMKVVSSNTFSKPSDISTSLRWIALLSNQVKQDLVASTGVHDGHGVIKQILAGATAVQTVSAIYEKGPKYINSILEDVQNWMIEKGFNSIDEFKGKVSYDKAINPVVFERTQFMKYYSKIT